ncbi:MAG: tryptophan-rich sensory protein [Chitinophagia bacterium]|jgi:hypothetical protein
MISSINRRTSLITWIAFFAVIMVNALANILPINGYNTGQVSDFYPNYFVPAPFTFSIWGVIYLMLLLYAITVTVFVEYKPLADHKAKDYIAAIHPWFMISCILNMAWIYTWHHLYITWTVIIMLLLLYSLIQVFIKGHGLLKTYPLYLQFLLGAPFTIYLGWITVATIANITALLVSKGWQGGPLGPDIWSAIMMTIAVVLALFMLLKFRIAGFSLTIAWALWGIRASQSAASEMIARISMAGVIALLVVTAIERVVTYFFTANNFKTIGW